LKLTKARNARRVSKDHARAFAGVTQAFGSNRDFLMDEHEARILADIDVRFSING
jgi:hypothetical protein